MSYRRLADVLRSCAIARLSTTAASGHAEAVRFAGGKPLVAGGAPGTGIGDRWQSFAWQFINTEPWAQIVKASRDRTAPSAQ